MIASFANSSNRRLIKGLIWAFLKVFLSKKKKLRKAQVRRTRGQFDFNPKFKRFYCIWPLFIYLHWFSFYCCNLFLFFPSLFCIHVLWFKSLRCAWWRWFWTLNENTFTWVSFFLSFFLFNDKKNCITYKINKNKYIALTKYIIFWFALCRDSN